MGQSVQIRLGLPISGDPKRHFRIKTPKILWLWIVTIVLLYSTVEAFPAASDNGPDGTDDTGLSDDYVGVITDDDSDLVTDAVPIVTEAAVDPTVIPEEHKDPTTANEPANDPVPVRPTVKPGDQLEQVKGVVGGAINSNHPDIPKDFNFTKITNDNIIYSEEKDGDRHILIRIPGKHSTGGALNPSVDTDETTDQPSQPDGTLDADSTGVTSVLPPNGDNPATTDSTVTGEEEPEDDQGQAPPTTEAPEEPSPDKDGKEAAPTHGWFRDPDGTINWLAILCLLFLLFI